MADDVLDHHDGVVHQNADGEDQRKQRDAVQRVAEEIENRQRQRQRDGNGQQHNAGFAPAERQRNQQRDRKGGDQQVLEQFVGLILGGLAVVAGDGDVQVWGDRYPRSSFTSWQQLFGDHGGVRAFALGKGDRHRRSIRLRQLPALRAALTVREQNVVLALRRDRPQIFATTSRR